MPTVRALFSGGGREGPPTDIEALPDGSPPPSVTFSQGIVTIARRGPEGRSVVTCAPVDVFLLTPHPPAGAGREPFRYIYTYSLPG